MLDMSSFHHNSVETVNAAATAIVTAQSRVQPSGSSVHNSVETVIHAAATAIVNAPIRVQPVQKSRWRSFWSLYSCFGSHKNEKRIGHAVRVPESTIPRNSASVTDISIQATSIVLPFIAPPPSPLQSDPPSATLSPARVFPVDSSSPLGETPSAYAIGPYAHETQLVSPPVFSAFTTEPSTASVTPPEPMQSTTPSSPEVSYAELLSTSVARSRKTYEANHRFSQYDYQPYQSPGSPGSRIISTGYTVPNSGTSSPFTNKPPKSISYDHFARKWGSRLGSGSLTPNGGWGSRLGSGSITPYGDHYIPENEISEVASLGNSDNEPENEETIVDHRLSFELTGVPHHEKNEAVAMDETVVEQPSPSIEAENGSKKDSIITNPLKEINTMEEGEEKLCTEKPQSTSLGSSKDFNFDHMKQESLDRSMIDCEWWKNDNRVATEVSSDNNWTFFPILHHGVSL